MNRFTLTFAALAVLSLALSVSLVAREAIALPGVRSDVGTRAIGTGFTYQGYLESAGTPVTDVCDVTFRLFADQAATTQIGMEDEHDSLEISNGYFSAVVNMTGVFTAAAFTGDPRWIQVELAGCGGPGFTTLPTQPITPAPYAIFSSEAGNAANLGGFAASQYARYARTIIVTRGATDVDSGNALIAALAGVTGASASNRYLIKLEPGRYDIGSNQLATKQFVDIEGSGRQATRISGTRIGTQVTVPINVELRDLRVDNTSPVNAVAMTVTTNAGATQGTVRIDNVHVYAAGSSALAISAVGSGSLQIVDSIIEIVTNGGNSSALSFSGLAGSAFQVSDSAVIALDDTSGINVTGLAISGQGSMNVERTSIAIDVSATGAVKGVSTSFGSVTVRDVMVDIQADSASSAIGVDCPSLSIAGAEVSVATTVGPATAVNFGDATITGLHASAIVSGAASAAGLLFGGNSATVSDSDITADSAGIGGSALLVQGVTLITVNRSRLQADLSTVIRAGGTAQVRIGASQLDGGDVVPQAIPFVCTGVYGENYVPLNADCTGVG